MKYALIKNGVIDTISYQPVDGWVQVPDTAFAGFIQSGGSWIAPPSDHPALLTTIYKSDIWRRATDAEAVIIDAQLKTAPIRLQRLWEDSQTLNTSDDLYPMILAAFIAAFQEARAAELLAPSA
jgi:hypothetical protein